MTETDDDGIPPPQPRERVNPPPLPDEQSRLLVRTLYIAGWTQPQISSVIGCDDKTLRKYYREELDVGKARIDALVTQSIIQMALGGKGTKDEPYDWKLASASMASFYAKCRMGWKEPPKDVKHSGAIGAYDLSKLTDDELDRVESILSRAVVSGAAGLPSGEGETQSGADED